MSIVRPSIVVCEVRWIGCLTSQSTIFQSHVWRHIDVQADWRRSWTWLADALSTSPLKPPTGIQRNLTGSKIETSSTKSVLFGPIGKTRWPPWTLMDWDIFDFSKYKKRLLLRCIHHFNRIELTTWTICAFRVLNPHQWSLAKKWNLKSCKVMTQKDINKLKPKGMV